MLLILLTLVAGIEYGSLKKNDLLPLKIYEDGAYKDYKLVLDANWHWAHDSNGNNCYTSTWVKTKGCFLEGVPKDEWKVPYGVEKIGESLKLSYVTKGPYSTNVGSRMYLMDGSRYKFFNLLDTTFSVTVDLSNVPCGLNAAIYFVNMPDVDAQMGLGYCDAQCPSDIKYLNGEPNVNKIGQCCREFDVAEMNSKGFQMAVHSCSKNGACSGIECGNGGDRHKGICDKDGNDLNYYRNGIDIGVDTSKPFTISTTFNNNIVKQSFIQNGKIVKTGELTDAVSLAQKIKYGEKQNAHGGLKAYDFSGQVLVLSLWDDSATHMKWLDSTFGSGAGSKRGPCVGQQDPGYLREKYPNSHVIISDIKFEKVKKDPDPIELSKFVLLNCTYTFQ